MNKASQSAKMLILVLGDLHMPHRKVQIPEQFRNIIKPGKVHKIFCLGNLTTIETYNWLKSICKDIICVNGEFDESIPDSKDTQVIKLGGYSIGLIHGHQVTPWGDPERLAQVGREMNVDVLISGHTNVPSIATYENRLYINPGSFTGAFSNTSPQSSPSFMVLDIRKDQMMVFQYVINDGGEVEIFQYNHTV